MSRRKGRDRQTEGKKSECAEREGEIETGRQTDRQTDRQIERQTDKGKFKTNREIKRRWREINKRLREYLE